MTSLPKHFSNKILFDTEKKKNVKNKELWIELDQLVSKHDVRWHWVKGHAGHEKNEIADQLANKGIDSL